MLFGKIKNTDDEWGFDVFEKTFDTFITISSSEHLNIIKAANTQGKLIKGDKDGKPILVDPPEPTEKEKNEQRINELESYLRITDWYAIRQADTGTPIPEEIKTKRQQARTEISALREGTV